MQQAQPQTPMTEQTPELRDALCKALFMLDHAAVPLAFALLDERGDGIPEDIRGGLLLLLVHVGTSDPRTLTREAFDCTVRLWDAIQPGVAPDRKYTALEALGKLGLAAEAMRAYAAVFQFKEACRLHARPVTTGD